MSVMTEQEQPQREEFPSADRRLGLRANLRHIGALVRRNAMHFRADPESMADAVLMPIIFTLLFVYVFGGAVSGGQGDYVNYLLPGLMAMGGMTLAMSVGAGINEDFSKGVMDRFRTMPIARSSVLIAKVIVEVCRMVVATLILLFVGFLVGFELHTDVLSLAAAVGLALFFGASLTWIFILLGLTLKTPQAVQGLGVLVIMPMQFGSSIFANPQTMPGWLETFTSLNPVSHVANGARALVNGEGAVAHPVMMTLLWGFGVTVVVMPLAVRKFRSKV